MNIIHVDALNLREVLTNDFYSLDSRKLINFLDLSWLTFNNYIIRGQTKDNRTVFADFYINIVNREDLPFEMEELSDDVKQVIHFVNMFEKRNPKQNLNDLEKEKVINLTETFRPLELFIAIQTATKNGNHYVDLYAEPSDASRDFFDSFTEEQRLRRMLTPLRLLNYLEKIFKKEKFYIKKMMPTPEQIEAIEHEGKEYQSQTIKIQNISVQYVYEPHATRDYHRHCEAWGVRGHYRHYKNGKVVYIKPHIKGSGIIKNTEYIIKEEKKK